MSWFKSKRKRTSQNKKSVATDQSPELKPVITSKAAASLEAALAELDKRPITTEETGIYRISGNVTEQRLLLTQMLSGKASKWNRKKWETYESNCLASTIKYVLREFQPLLTYRQLDTFVSAKNNPRALKRSIQLLPSLQQRCLKTLLVHLARIAAHHTNTKMTPENLAIVFMPQLCRSDEDPMSGLRLLKEKTSTVAELIKMYSDPAETRNNRARAAPQLPELEEEERAGGRSTVDQ